MTLHSAIEECTKNDNCQMFYSPTCNTDGPFKLCQHESDVQESAVETCAYSKITDSSEIPIIQRENGKNIPPYNSRSYGLGKKSKIMSFFTLHFLKVRLYGGQSRMESALIIVSL